MVREININEENEVLREKYMERLRKLKLLYKDGTLVLNQRILEKVCLYLQTDKVLNAAGVDPNEISLKEKEKLSKRIKRSYIT